MEHLDNRSVALIRGDGLGGTSRVNTLLYTRGAPLEYNHWKNMGHSAWGYDELKPYFVRSEKSLSHSKSDFHGGDGPWENQTFPDLQFEVLKHVRPAAAALGIPEIPDINAPDAPPVGCAMLDVSIDASMRRASTYSAFLPADVAFPRKERLKICTRSIVTGIEVATESSGLRAKGIYFERLDPSSKTFYARAKREVVLCCGALGSPQLLMLSGIGPKEHLQDHGISVVRDMPGVGSHLQDHIDIPVTFETPIEDSLHVLLVQPWRAVSQLAKYFISSKGLFAMPVTQMAVFVKSSLLDDNSEIRTRVPEDEDNVADIEIKAIPVNGSHIQYPKLGVFSLLPGLVRPKSTGRVMLASTNPRDHPAVDLGFLSTAEDYAVLRKGVKLALRLGEQIRLQGYPLKNLQALEGQSDEGLDSFIRAHARSGFHYSCTCRMAPETDPVHPGVVDDELRVYGIHGLRVCDTSIFPEILSAHTMAPAVVVAEKCADMMKSAPSSGT
ncbi:alcohol oxidase [Gloeophyllum trabeum ATCC 11539]|uniref:Alcohol oxidase n=1 Tax=Gloeophyllum trabeum (strain ATCC 11539 / FP-39264 / Madison 617) TaxID=670483 RepID=S7Q2W7_GLOTA|nr:alcohol oxidase [Gloeophyllum trabeum ATCC 11539]EPQ54341.1 alcohol oxidase [Gloeophyllum trabeum ATCC 11539]